MSDVPVSVGRYILMLLSWNSNGSPDSLPLITTSGQSIRLHICLNDACSLSLSKAVSIGSTLPSMSCASLMYSLSSFSPLHVLWKSMRFFAKALVVPVLVVIRLGSHRGESGDGVVAATLVLIAPILVVFLWFILVRRSVTIGFGGCVGFCCMLGYGVGFCWR